MGGIVSKTNRNCSSAIVFGCQFNEFSPTFIKEDPLIGAVMLHQHEWVSMVQVAVEEGDPVIIAFWQRQIANALQQREISRDALLKAATEKAQMAKETVEHITAHLLASGLHFRELNVAMESLRLPTLLDERNAARAQRAIHTVSMRTGLDPEARSLLKRADLEARDAFVLRCRACCSDPQDREDWLDKTWAAYNGDLDLVTRAALLGAYHKSLHHADRGLSDVGFASNTEIGNWRRGATRRRRARCWPQMPEGAEKTTASSSELPAYGRTSGTASSSEQTDSVPLYADFPWTLWDDCEAQPTPRHDGRRSVEDPQRSNAHLREKSV